MNSGTKDSYEAVAAFSHADLEQNLIITLDIFRALSMLDPSPSCVDGEPLTQAPRECDKSRDGNDRAPTWDMSYAMQSATSRL